MMEIKKRKKMMKMKMKECLNSSDNKLNSLYSINKYIFQSCIPSSAISADLTTNGVSY
jgi:hypothetical protein